MAHLRAVSCEKNAPHHSSNADKTAVEDLSWPGSSAVPGHSSVLFAGPVCCCPVICLEVPYSGRWFGGGEQCPCLELAVLTASCARSGKGTLSMQLKQEWSLVVFSVTAKEAGPWHLLLCLTPVMCSTGSNLHPVFLQTTAACEL